MNTKFGANVSNRMLLNAAKSQGYSFYRFGVIKGKPTAGGGGGGGVKLPPQPPQPLPRLGLMAELCFHLLMHLDCVPI